MHGSRASLLIATTYLVSDAVSAMDSSRFSSFAMVSSVPSALRVLGMKASKYRGTTNPMMMTLRPRILTVKPRIMSGSYRSLWNSGKAKEKMMARTGPLM